MNEVALGRVDDKYEAVNLTLFESDISECSRPVSTPLFWCAGGWMGGGGPWAVWLLQLLPVGEVWGGVKTDHPLGTGVPSCFGGW
jgi:hypothetical protein